jgi:crotonobetainyl-CoA:carnitine CoA-transferase CaiB-like acyl-CoA transferase
LAALAHRDASGLGQYVDLSMQDIAAWATQTLWNGAPRPWIPPVAARGQAHVLGEGRDCVPVLSVREVLDAPQTLARRLWFPVEMEGASFPLLAVPFRLHGATPPVRHPAPPLGRHTKEIAEEITNEIARGLPRSIAAYTEEP